MEATMDNQTEVARTQSKGNVSQDQNGRAAAPESALRPAVDIFETEDGVTLRADMPGVSKDRLNVRVDSPNLLVEGRIGIAPQDQMQALYADVRAAVYRRTFMLSNEF